MVLWNRLALPLAIVMPLTWALAFSVMRVTHVIMPPLAATSLLPFAIPGDVSLFPVFATFGGAYLMVCARTDVRRFLRHGMVVLVQGHLPVILTDYESSFNHTYLFVRSLSVDCSTAQARSHLH